MRALATLTLAGLVLGLSLSVTPTWAKPSADLAGSSSVQTDFSCSGPVHKQALNLWEQTARPYFSTQISNSLNKMGDVYVLYNTQEEMQSFVEMTRRCKDTQQVDELAATLNPAFASLHPLPDGTAVEGWICTGGGTCTRANKLLGTEVQLCSAQFLGLLGAVATDIVETVPASKRTENEKSFLVNATSAMAAQVNHWFTPAYFATVAKRMQMTPADAKDGSSAYFFEDRDLWFMTTLSDLSELHEAGVQMNSAGTQAFHELQSKSPQIATLFNLFLERTAVAQTTSGPLADIDRGFERNYVDHKYAAYSGAASPVQCQKNGYGKMVKMQRVQAAATYIDPNVGWDISHARRLVPALDTFVRNKTNIAKVFNYTNARFDPLQFQHAFANQVVEKIWNKDSDQPLFGNYWDGSNGWYRSGYDNGTGSCVEGSPPFSLTWSFPTGGYPKWGAFNSTIKKLGIQLYQLLNTNSPNSNSFVNKYYFQVVKNGKVTTPIQNVWLLSFVSSIVGIG